MQSYPVARTTTHIPFWRLDFFVTLSLSITIKEGMNTFSKAFCLHAQDFSSFKRVTFSTETEVTHQAKEWVSEDIKHFPV